MFFVFLLTIVDPVANVAPPASLIDEVDEGIDVRPALPTSANLKLTIFPLEEHSPPSEYTPDYCLALYDRQVAEVLERVDQDAERQPRLLKDGLGLGDFGQGAAENVRRAVDVVPQFGVQPRLWHRHRFAGQDVPVVKQVDGLHSLQKGCDHPLSNSCISKCRCSQGDVFAPHMRQLTVEENAD